MGPIEIDFSQRDFWLRYSQSSAASQQMGIVPVKWQTFKFISPAGERISRSMLSIYEMSLLYALARHFYKGRGRIVDAGPLLGASTFALARGLADNIELNKSQLSAAIYSYDLFRSHGYEKFLGDIKPAAITGSLLPEFVGINHAHIDSIVIHQGDFMSWPWPGEPIEILFLDLAKSWSLNTYAIRNYFTHLVPGEFILIQQDYVHFNEYWIHITMEHFEEYFQPLGYLYGATAYYSCTKQVSFGDAAINLEALPYATKMQLLTRARAKAPAGVQEVMKSAAAKCAIENGQLDEAKSLLDSVDLTVTGDHPTANFSGIAKSNYENVMGMLQRARGAARLS